MFFLNVLYPGLEGPIKKAIEIWQREKTFWAPRSFMPKFVSPASMISASGGPSRDFFARRGFQNITARRSERGPPGPQGPKAPFLSRGLAVSPHSREGKNLGPARASLFSEGRKETGVPFVSVFGKLFSGAGQINAGNSLPPPEGEGVPFARKGTTWIW